MTTELIYNAALLIALSSLYGVITHYYPKGSFIYKVWTGCLFGIIAIAGMYLAVPYVSGIFYDARSVVMVLAGLFGGFYPTTIAAVMAILYRASIGGFGVWAGIASIISAAAVGLIFRKLWHNKPYTMSPLALLGMGIIAHLFMIGSQLLLPQEIALQTISLIWKPIMAVFPLATMLMGILLENEERRVISEKNLRESKDLLHIAQKIAQMGSWEYNLSTNKFVWSENMPAVFDLSLPIDTLNEEDFMEVIIPEDRHCVAEFINRIKEEKKPFDFEVRILDSNKNIRYIHNKLIPIIKDENVVVIKGVSKDVTEARLAKIQLNNNLEEKEILLKEIHHRVKNNLNVIISLLNLQGRYVHTKEEALKAFEEIRNRIYSISLVHAKLYQSGDFSHVDMKGYIETNLHHYFQELKVEKFIETDIHVDSICLDINAAIPCGLIINELVINILKHAFPDKRRGKLFISFHKTLDHKHLELIIGDDGVGLREDFDINHAESLGLKIVSLLVKQIQGDIEVIKNKGTIFKITFPCERQHVQEDINILTLT
ncbi:MAG: histidine kinase dimerization/phosphoacceptor domain -containing protein [Candidatus Marinimicrobia bacterium]|nr:histidine kinase dimerization/phosphoacceptor domain -containing protein [Candidatus Neomarinimicrobiota bacterium]